MFEVTSSNKSTIETQVRPMSQAPVNEKRRNYRFYAGDPAIHPAEKRLYANGDFEGTPLHVSGGTDPRNPNRSDRSHLDLPVPKFKLDRCWVGAIPAKEVTFRNLNDNITKTFLTDVCKRFGEIDDCKIYYDRQTKKHLGLGTVIFKTTKAARECVKALHMTTKMGSIISVSLETSGQERTKQYASIIRAQEQEKAAQEKALAASAAASPPPSMDSNFNKQSDPSQMSMQLPVNHKRINNSSQSSSSYPSRDQHRPSRFQPISTRFDSRSRHPSNDNTDQYSFDSYGSFGNNSNNCKSSSRRSRRRSHNNRRPHSEQRRRRRKTSSSATSSSSSRSSSSSSSSTSSSTSRSYSVSSSSSSRTSYSSTHSQNRRSSNNARSNNSKQQKDDEVHRPSLDERIAALFQQQQNTHSSSMPTKTHHRPLPLPNTHPPNSFAYPPPPLSSPMTNIVGSHHHHQQSYGVVNNFNFFGNSFPPASFLNSAGGTNWQDMFKQPPPSSSSSSTTTTTMSANVTITNQSHISSNGFQLYPTDGVDERERKTNDLTNAVTNVVSGELVEILRKDLAKKLIETLVYKSIETWYDIEERKDKIKRIKSAESSTTDNQTTSNEQSSNHLHHSTSNPSLERTPDELSTPTTPMTAPPFSSSTSSTNLSTYFEHIKDNIGSSVRAQMPKIPSFKKRTNPDDKPLIPQKSAPSSEKKEPPQQQPRKVARKRLSSSSSESNETPENDDSQSRDSVSMPTEETSLSEVKSITKVPAEPSTPEEEEGEIKDDEDEKEESEEKTVENSTSTVSTTLPPPLVIKPPSTPPPLTPPKKNKNLAKQPKKSSLPKKRKINQVKSDSIQDQDDVDNSTLAKRKKSIKSHHHATTNNKVDDQPIQTVNLLDSLPVEETRPPYNPFAYIEFEHDYAFMTKQPIPVAKRLTVDGLNDMGVQAPVIIPMTVKFSPREHDAEMRIMYEIDQGVDEEDMSYLKQSFQKLCEEGHSCTTKTRWVDHPASRDSPFVKQPPEKHRTGCARTEGYYKIVKDEKVSPMKTTDSSQSSSVLPQAILDTNRTTTGAQMSRELRSEHRRNLLALGDAEFADHFKFSQLKLRKKRLRYAKSGIHAWGLFACEPIAMEDMVIEYVGETIRQSIGDLREKQYELEGTNSNYMFRVDSDTIVDATKCGNLARFINHSCDPNCYAKIIPVESQKKIVIYSRRDIRLGEEITYDYKFPLEEQKIPCLCGTPVCRGSLN